MTDARQQTTLPAGVVRIAAGTTEFDNYYCDLEELTGGKTFMKVWNIGGANFLLQMYDKLESNQSTALNLAVFNAEKKTFAFVTGLPTDISALGNEPYVENGVAYMAVSTEAGCAIYAINASTGVATEGLKVEGASSINGIGRLAAQK
jgi:hydroxyethylthiazole kinase-like sugar kinase family protein